MRKISEFNIAIFLLIALCGTAVAEETSASPSQEEIRMRELIREEIAVMQGHHHSEMDDFFNKIDIHGFVSQGYMQSTNNNFLTKSKDGSLEFNEMAINFRTELSEKLSVGLQLFSRDLGDVGNNEIVLDWAYGDYHFEDWLGLRVGRVKVPLGFYNETRDFDMLRSSILLPQSVYNELYRDTASSVSGIMLYGDIPTEKLGVFSYQGLWGAVDADTDSGLAKFFQDELSNSSIQNVDIENAYGINIVWETPAEGLKTGVSFFELETNIDAKTVDPMPIAPGVTLSSGTDLDFSLEDLRLFVASTEYTIGDLILASEYSRIKGDALLVGLAGAPLGNITLMQEANESEGYYVSASYRVNEWFQPGTYFSVYEFPGSNAKTRDIALTTRFDLSEHWTFKLEAHFFEGTELLLAQDNPDGMENDWMLFLAKMTFSF